MSKLTRILVIIVPVMIIIAVFVQTSTEPRIITNHPNYGVFLGLWYVIILGLFIWLIAILSLPRLSVTFGGGVGGWAKAEFGDSPIHDGGYIRKLIVTIGNTGGRKLNLETRAMLRDREDGSNLFQANLMTNPPLSDQMFLASEIAKVSVTPPICPQLLPLEPNQTQIYTLYFFVDKFIVERLGSGAIANNTQIQAPKAATSEGDLIFIDRGLGVMFDCTLKGQSGNKYKCRRSRLH